MRRQGYEFQVSPSQRDLQGKGRKKLEPIELLMIEVPDGYVGAVMEKLGAAQGGAAQHGHQGFRHYPPGFKIRPGA